MENGGNEGVPGWLVAMLVCPVDNSQKLSPVSGARLAGLNRRIGAGGLKDRGGKVVGGPVESGLLREDGAVLYIIRDGIPDLIPEDGIELETGDVE